MGTLINKLWLYSVILNKFLEEIISKQKKK